MSKREADEDLSPVPSLGEVAEKARFAPLHELLEPVKDAPVNELSEELRQELLEGQEKHMRLLLKAFFAACDARAEEVARKRPNVGSDESAHGEQQRFPFFFSLFALMCALSSGPLATLCL